MRLPPGVKIADWAKQRPPFRKGDRFRIDWDKLIAAQFDKESKQYQIGERKKYGDNLVYVAQRVFRGGGGAGYIIEYEMPDNPKLWGGIGVRFAVKVQKEKQHGQENAQELVP